MQYVGTSRTARKGGRAEGARLRRASVGWSTPMGANAADLRPQEIVGEICRLIIKEFAAGEIQSSSRSISEIRLMTRSRATLLYPPSGMITSAQRFDGSTNSRCMGLTVAWYWATTLSTER